MKLDTLLKKLDQIKYPLLVLLIGVGILLWPASHTKDTAESPDAELRDILASAEGVGETRVLISEHGVVIVCEGADDAAVKLDILRAIGSYTGFGSDKITILRLGDH